MISGLAYKLLKDQVSEHEGFRSKPYKDTMDVLTIGFGRNLSANGITRQEAEVLLENDLRRVMGELEGFTWFDALDEVRKVALCDMCFNLGLGRFLAFGNMLAAVRAADWEKASKEMLNSNWASQVGRRAKRLAEMVRTGKYPSHE